VADALETAPPIIKVSGDWQIDVAMTVKSSSQLATPDNRPSELTARLDVSPPVIISVHAERYARVPMYNANDPNWRRGVTLNGVRANECASRGLLDPASLQVRAGPQADAARFELGKDYAADLDWGTFGRLPNGRIRENQPVYVDYRHGMLRIDTVVLTGQGRIVLRRGEPHAAAPLPPDVHDGEQRLANIWLPAWTKRLGAENLLLILETSYPEPPKASPSPAEQLLPKTMVKLRGGQTVRVLAWGDSVTDGRYLPDAARWQAQFVARLQARFPKAKIELVTEAWGGRNTDSYLAEPAGSPHNYREKVLAARPDLVVSEFVNDAGLSPKQVEQRYTPLLADFTAGGAEWIILTPHYIRGDWMGLSSQRDIDNDPRPYVTGLRQFAARHHVALADASLRYGRLWRQGIPYVTLMLNAINHPDARGMKIFADSLMALFP
jgi:lysophospholipase L1-like esterase